MSQNDPNTLLYYDVILSLPYLPKWNETTLKIPAYNIFQVFHYMEFIHNVTHHFIKGANVYKVTKKRGNTRIDFTIVEKIDIHQLELHKSLYTKMKKKGL